MHGDIDEDELAAELQLQTDSLILKTGPDDPPTSADIGADAVGEMADAMSQLLFEVVSNPVLDTETPDADEDGLYAEVVDAAREFIGSGPAGGLTLADSDAGIGEPDDPGTTGPDQFDYL